MAWRELVLDPQELALRPPQVAEADGVVGRVGGRVGGALVADHGVLVVGVAHLPVGRVRAHVGQVDPRGDGRVDPLAHRPGPVLAVAGRHQQAVVEELARVAVDVDVGDVGEVEALALQEAHQLVLVVEQVELARPVGPLERDVARAHPVGALVVVEALAAPAVVGQPRVHGHLHERLGGGARGRAHDEGHPAGGARVGPAGQHELGEVVAAHPVGADVDRCR